MFKVYILFFDLKQFRIIFSTHALCCVIILYNLKGAANMIGLERAACMEVFADKEINQSPVKENAERRVCRIIR